VGFAATPAAQFRACLVTESHPACRSRAKRRQISGLARFCRTIGDVRSKGDASWASEPFSFRSNSTSSCTRRCRPHSLWRGNLTATLRGSRCEFDIPAAFAVGDVGAVPIPPSRQEVAENEKRSRDLFEKFMREHGVPRGGDTNGLSCGWLKDAPEGDQFLGSYGRVFELIVLAKPGRDSRSPRIIVLTVEGGAGVPGPTGEQLCRYLQFNGVPAKPLTVSLEGRLNRSS
jgi:hypothetical protein